MDIGRSPRARGLHSEQEASHEPTARFPIDRNGRWRRPESCSVAATSSLKRSRAGHQIWFYKHFFMPKHGGNRSGPILRCMAKRILVELAHPGVGSQPGIVVAWTLVGLVMALVASGIP